MSKFPIRDTDGTTIAVGAVETDITERKRAEEALRKSEELFTTVLDHMPAPVYLRDLEGRFKLINREYGKVWGVTKDGVRGKTPHEVFPKQQADEFMVLDRAVLKERRVQQTEETYSLADGKHFLAVTKFPIFDLSGEVVGVGGIDVDITVSKRAEEALAAKEAQLSLALKYMPGGIKVVDEELKYVLINRQYSELYEFPDDLLKVGASMRDELRYQAERGDLGSGNKEDLVEGIVARYQEAQTTGEHKSFERQIHSGRTLQVTIAPTPTGGAVTIASDITKRKQAEEALEEAYEVIKHQKERMEGELNVAHEIQMSMLPLTFPPFPQRHELAVFATLEPAREVGGDFYDFFFIDEGRFCFCVGDVSGKGVPAALFMAVTKTLVKSRAANDFSPASILTHVNDELGRENDSCMFVTLFMGILDVRTGALAYTNAGHNPPYLLPRDGTAVRLDRCHGPVIGAMEGMVYQEDKITVSPGDLLFLYTDGVTEAMDVKQQLYSEERLAALLSSRDFESVEEIVDVTVANVWGFQGEGEQADDVTVLAVQFFGEPEGEALQVFELSITNRVDEIARVNQSFNAFAKRHGIAAGVRRKMNVVFEELLSNIVSHAYRDEGEHTIDLRAELSADRLAITITDDGRPFNPFTSAAPDTAVSMEERQMGGLGIHLVRNMMDEVSYSRRTDKNVVILVKHLEAGSDA
jgi:sigma-B regulation protein RsbU (phosphoserine phosphatase)